jgi:hypothetical protein
MTKRFTLLLLFLTAGIVSYAQSSFVFLNKGTPVADNSTVYHGELVPEYGIVKSPINIQKIVDDEIEATLTITVSANSHGGFIGYCGWGFDNCIIVQIGGTLSSTKYVENNNAIEPDIEAMGFESTTFFFEVEYKLTYNGQEQKINVVLSSNPVAIHAPEASTDASVLYQDEKAVLKYHFSSAGERQVQIYNFTGSKIAKIELNGDNGIVPLPGLSKGIYLYDITKNGKVVSSGKYIVK